MNTDDNFGIAYKNIKQVWIFSCKCKYEMQCNDKFFGTELDPSRLRDCSDVCCCPQPGCGSEGGNGIYKWNLSHYRVKICCSSCSLTGMCPTAATTSPLFIEVPTQINKDQWEAWQVTCHCSVTLPHLPTLVPTSQHSDSDPCSIFAAAK